MKTPVVMERDLHGMKIRQTTKDGFFNANDLLALYEKTGGPEKRIERYMSTKSTQEYISAIQADILNSTNSGELESPQVYYGKRGKYGGTWMHPFLFVDFAMWLSPEFKLTCVKWIYDNLIMNRIEAGDTFKEVNAALSEHVPKITWMTYSNEARMINKIVFGDPKGGQRNEATEKQLEKLKFLQKADVKLIADGLDYYDRFEKLKELSQYI